MLRFRSFRNTDPPLIAEIWRSCDGQPGWFQPVSPGLFEQFVFGKLHFDPAGLLMAFDDDRPVGFAHASFGPSESRRGVSTKQGVVCAVAVRPDCSRDDVAVGLLERCEAYLAERGAENVQGGALYPNNPFYLGLYGGCELPGVLDSDTVVQRAFVARGYAAVCRTLVFRHDLTRFRPSIDRQHLQLRRRMMVRALVDPPSQDWWEACTTGDFELTRFELMARGVAEPAAHVTMREMVWDEGLRPGRAAGILRLFVNPECRRQGCACFLLGDVFQTLAGQGVTIVEAQTTDDNEAAAGVFRKLGFQEIAGGAVFRRDLSESR